ncbi:MAG: GPP34 family phosphoprotein, partial [Actinomycetes bacterium]
MLLAEELLLLGLSPARGTVVNGARQQLTVGLAGALVAELALDGLVELRAKTFVVAGEPPAAPLLHDTYVDLASGKGRHSKGQLRRLDRALGRVWPRLTDGLGERRVLGRRQDRVLPAPAREAAHRRSDKPRSGGARREGRRRGGTGGRRRGCHRRGGRGLLQLT